MQLDMRWRQEKKTAHYAGLFESNVVVDAYLIVTYRV
jgi:hypothetical protein